MKYIDAKNFLFESSKYGSVLGLASVKNLLNKLDNPQDDLKHVHIAGTNGKGSVLAFTSSILSAASYKVGRFCSPALDSYREIIQINEDYIDEESIRKYISKIKNVIDEILKDGFPHPTRFEIEFALACLYFKDEKCDLVLLETGMGGIEDATNIIKSSLIDIISSISIDHLSILGATIEEIAYKKVGIIKDNSTVISAQQNRIVKNIIENEAKNKNSKLIYVNNVDIIESGIEKQVFSYTSTNNNKYANATISLAGLHQFQNASIAIETVEKLRDFNFNISEKNILDGLLKAQWKGRFTIIEKNPMVIIDGAHNEDASKQLVNSIKLYFKEKRIIFLMAIFEDKDYESIVRISAKYADEIILINILDVERILDSYKLEKVVKKYNQNVKVSKNLEDAVNLSLLTANKEDVIIAFGSLSFLADIEKMFKRLKR